MIIFSLDRRTFFRNANQEEEEYLEVRATPDLKTNRTGKYILINFN